MSNPSPASFTARRVESLTTLRLRMAGITSESPPAPVNIWRILRGDDPTLKLDTLILYDRLCAEMGQLELGRVIVMEYPMLIKDKTPLLVVWWLLSNIADVWLQPDALLVPAPRGWGEGTGEGE